MTRFVMILGLVFLSVCPSISQQSEKYVREEAAIRKVTQEYIDAFNRADIKALVGLWDENAEYTSVSGQRVQGRVQIEAALQNFFSENKGVKLELQASEIEVAGPENASEEGLSIVTYADGSKDEANFVVRYVRKGEQWKIARACETPGTPSNYENLKQFEWLIGEWVDDQKEPKMEILCDWSQNRNFISLSFRNQISDCETIEGTQVIGWDSAAQKVKSWMFDSLGGFAEGVWSGKTPLWMVKTSGVIINGIKTSATNIFSYVDKDTFSFASTRRRVGGKNRPDIGEVKMVRRLPGVDNNSSE